MKQRRRSLLVLPLIPLAALAACGGDDDDSGASTAPPSSEVTESSTETSAVVTEPTSPPEPTDASTTSAPSEAIDLSGICPATVVIQTDWYPEAEHGFLYNLVGNDHTIDKTAASVHGALTVHGADTGVDIEIRSGGPAIGEGVTPSEQMYIDDDILLGFVYTDEAIQNSTRLPTIAIESGFEKNPLMIMWDPATYPDVHSIEDIGKAGIVVRYRTGVAYMDYFTQTGILSADQVEGGYDGTPDRFTTDEGRLAQQGFGSAEPYLYEHEVPNWMKPVAYDYVNDAGWENYAQSIATRPENIETYRDCFTQLVPIIQQSSVDYVEDPDRANAIIIEAVEEFDTFWSYSPGLAAYGVETMVKDGLMANGPDDTVGNFDLDRVNGLIEKAVPIYENGGSEVKDGLTADDIVTNEFIDESIGF